MARIRSTHPGQWSDEDFVSLSFPARLLALAIRNIADDHGIFEWKPITLKMQLFPADAVDVSALLSELQEHNVAVMFEHAGKKLGAVRNFMRWQRPKKPNYTYPVTPDVLNYVGVNSVKAGTDEASGEHSSEPVPNQSPTGSEKSAQRKEVGGSSNKKEDMSEPSSDGPPKRKKSHTYTAAFEAFWSDYPTTPNMSKLRAGQAWDKLSEDDHFLCHKALPAYREFLSSKPDHPVMHAATFISERRFEGFSAQSAAAIPRPTSDDDWQKRLKFGRENSKWHHEAWGPFPGSEGCRVPQHLLQPQDGHGWAVWEV